MPPQLAGVGVSFPLYLARAASIPVSLYPCFILLFCSSVLSSSVFSAAFTTLDSCSIATSESRKGVITLALGESLMYRKPEVLQKCYRSVW